MRMLVLNADGLVVNAVEVDPDSDWHPGEGLIAGPVPDDEPVWIGWTTDGDTWTPPAPAEADVVEAVPTQEDRLAELEALVAQLVAEKGGDVIVPATKTIGGR